MKAETTKIVNWAAGQTNGHGAHIQAISEAIESGRVAPEIVTEIKGIKSEWVSEHYKRFGM